MTDFVVRVIDEYVHLEFLALGRIVYGSTNEQTTKCKAIRGSTQFHEKLSFPKHRNLDSIKASKIQLPKLTVHAKIVSEEDLDV